PTLFRSGQSADVGHDVAHLAGVVFVGLMKPDQRIEHHDALFLPRPFRQARIAEHGGRIILPSAPNLQVWVEDGLAGQDAEALALQLNRVFFVEDEYARSFALAPKEVASTRNLNGHFQVEETLAATRCAG